MFAQSIKLVKEVQQEEEKGKWSWVGWVETRLRGIAGSRPSLPATNTAGSLPPGDRRSHLDGGDAGEIERVARLGPGQGADPGIASLGDVTLDDAAGVEEEDRHLSGARG